MSSSTNRNLIEEMISLIDSCDDRRGADRTPVSETALQLKNFIDGIPGGFLIYRAYGDEEILYSNRALHKIFACENFAEFCELTGKSFKGLVHPDDLEDVEKSIADQIHVSGDNLDYVEYRIRDKDGNIRWVEDYGHFVHSDSIGDIFYVFITDATEKIVQKHLSDIDKKKMLADALKSANVANIAKDSFLSNMSHDMRTPLNAIFGFANLAKKNLSDAAAAEAYIEKIEQSSKQILELTEHVLELSYMDSQDFHITEKECDLRETLYAVYSASKDKARSKNIGFVRNLSRVSHPVVLADREKLLQILGHICDNAVKYTHKDGSVNITVTETTANCDGYSVFRFDIADTGIGISPDVLEKVFAPFEREHNTTAVGEYGSGLGLTIAKHLTEIMGGSISAQSEVGVGSTFTVTLTLRIKECAEKPDDGKADIPPHLRGSKLLLVEDNEINLEIETEILEDLGFEVDTAENGKIAVEKMSAAKAGEYAFVLMDIQMPVMDGRQAAAEIRKLSDPLVAGIPIIALSANALESDKRASIKNGMNAHLPKPMDVDLLLKTLSEILK